MPVAGTSGACQTPGPMSISKQKDTFITVLPNGNRVTVTVGMNRSGTYKTVSVRRPNGSTHGQIYRRGVFLVWLFGGMFPYSKSIPSWAKQ
jgi:hypothetical protein